MEKPNNMPEKKKITTKKSVKKEVLKKSPARKSVNKKTTTVKKSVKKVAKVSIAEKVENTEKDKKNPLVGKYMRAIGRRKRSIASVRLFQNGKGEIIVNKKEYKDYFPVLAHQKSVEAPLEATGNRKAFDFSIKVYGGGVRGQAEAVMLGIARALVLFDAELKTSLKKPGYLTRDPRKKERKKPGLKGARRAPQWSKR